MQQQQQNRIKLTRAEYATQIMCDSRVGRELRKLAAVHSEWMIFESFGHAIFFVTKLRDQMISPHKNRQIEKQRHGTVFVSIRIVNETEQQTQTTQKRLCGGQVQERDANSRFQVCILENIGFLLWFFNE